MIKFQESIKNVLVTGGCGFIGGVLVKRLLQETNLKIFNLDKVGYASNLDITHKETKAISNNSNRYQFLKVNLTDRSATQDAIELISPDIVFNLAAESHVDTSISMPEIFIESNIIGTFNLLESLRSHWINLPTKRKDNFLILHISTDEVFGSLGKNGLFSEISPYNPRSPYSASKASSDHLVKSWYYTYGLPSIITNCSNNYGPWQFPEKLIPLVILNSINNKRFPIYGDGRNIRDWIYVEDHIDALFKVILNGEVGSTYCIGGNDEKTNEEIVSIICRLLDKYHPMGKPHIRLKNYVKDRLGHDKRYGVDTSKVTAETGWRPQYKFEEGIDITVKWYLQNIDWCERIKMNSL